MNDVKIVDQMIMITYKVMVDSENESEIIDYTFQTLIKRVSTAGVFFFAFGNNGHQHLAECSASAERLAP